MSEKTSKSGIWTNNTLLAIIIAMIGYFMTDFTGWKQGIEDRQEHNSEKIEQNEKESLIKNQEQDIFMLENQKEIIRLTKENKEFKAEMIKMGGFN